MPLRDSDLLHSVYAEYGLTMHVAQVFEQELAVLLTLLTHGFADDDDDLWEATFGKATARPLGNALTKVKKQVEIPEDHERALDGALRARNRLAHGFFLGRNLHDVTQAKACGREILGHRMTVQAADSIVSDVVESLLAHLGADAHAIRRAATARLERRFN